MTQKEENRAVMGESCYGPCVVFKDDAMATRWGRMGGSQT